MKVLVRQLTEADLPAAKGIYHLSFQKMFDVPDALMSDEDHVRTRFLREPEGSLCVELDGELAAISFVCRWGSVAIHGPKNARPDRFLGNAGRQLTDAVIGLADSWGVGFHGGFTFAQSPKHIDHFQQLGFWPRSMFALLTQPVQRTAAQPAAGTQLLRYSQAPEADRAGLLRACFSITDEIHSGLDAAREIAVVAEHGWGDTLLLFNEGTLEAFAVLHQGEGTEAGGQICFAKFAAVRPGPNAERWLGGLLDGMHAYSAQAGLQRINLGLSTGRVKAYRRLIQRGFVVYHLGIGLHRPNIPAFCRPDCYVLDTWR